MELLLLPGGAAATGLSVVLLPARRPAMARSGWLFAARPVSGLRSTSSRTEHVDLPFHNDAEVGVVEHVFTRGRRAHARRFQGRALFRLVRLPPAEPLRLFRRPRAGAGAGADSFFGQMGTTRAYRPNGVIGMYGLTRATTTLLFAAAAGLVIWIATQIDNGHTSGYWARVGLVAGAGLLMAMSQVVGGWTKWGRPRALGRRSAHRIRPRGDRIALGRSRRGAG